MLWSDQLTVFLNSLINILKEFICFILSIVLPPAVELFFCIICLIFRKNEFKIFLGASSLSAIVAVLSEVFHRQMAHKRYKDYVDQYSEVLAQIRGQQHKFSNQIDVIYAMHNLYTDYDELVKKQQEQAGVLRRALIPNDVVVLNNPIVIVHVYQKINEILERGIPLHSSFSCSLCGVTMPDIQLVNVIGTLLDNAMEALEQKVGNRDMYFRIAEGKERNTVVIEVGNVHEYIPVSQWKRFFEQDYSNKGENRGIGLAELKRIVTRYKGNIFVENRKLEEENVFFVSVALNIKCVSG